ncbi:MULTISPECIES: STAS domain-containing protein [Fictibacillus]|uniref:Anti-anti-sigma factor n=1 Tax=Fictibacillus enclensis TaxID=1017270 RepID=A0A0V8JCI0_9BACL|nr:MULTISPECIES: STAS domain-containing protein [Fictibacillus]KSU84902.1 anti-anti-sigma factor [Fictibacillus enclensis]RXY99443.1 STAS domain-containing protein [Fictibacillus sp. S7]SCB87602.1 Anti-anti-sigma regulatory factor (antagonist of anti-sigma factor) [Fictibacillus enclensis]
MEKLQQKQIMDFIEYNREEFQTKLLSEAGDVAGKINDILQSGNIDLLKNAEKMIKFVVENRDNELVSFAQQEGVAWARHALTLTLKLEWVHAIRRTIWHYMYEFDLRNTNERSISDYRETIFQMEQQVNDGIDKFLNSFFISYSTYKDELISTQRKMVEHLSVPIIPISPFVAVLPLIGVIDVYRIDTIEEKVLTEISNMKIRTLIIDLSGITDMDIEVIHHFQKVLSGVSLMGCEAVITGLRAELVRKMIHLDISFDQYASTKGTLQQTLTTYFKTN